MHRERNVFISPADIARKNRQVFRQLLPLGNCCERSNDAVLRRGTTK